MRPTLLLLHGWSFDATLWDPLAMALGDLPMVRWDRGYFGAPFDDAVSGPVIGIGHSLGSLLLADSLPPDAPLIAINGFDHFTGTGGVPSRVMARMQTRFSEMPSAVLGDFRDRCGASPVRDADLQTGRLAADLTLLATHRAGASTRPVLVLQGGNDPILPESLREVVFPGATRISHSDAGHLLPVTHPAWCAQHIHDFLCR